MPSTLTRQIFRRLLANEPILHRGCLRRHGCDPSFSIDGVARLRRSPNGPHPMRYVQRRTFLNFNMFAPPKPKAGDPNMDPGVEKMMEYAKMERLQARLPPPGDVAHALQSFFHHKAMDGRSPVTDTQAKLALQSFCYCASQDEGQAVMAPQCLADIIQSLYTSSFPVCHESGSGTHAELAKTVYETILDRSLPFARRRQLVLSRVAALEALGRPDEAMDVAQQFEQWLLEQKKNIKHPPADPTPHDTGDSWDFLWSLVLKAYARQDDEDKLLSVLAAIRERIADPRQIAIVMLDFYLRQPNRPGEVKKRVAECHLSNGWKSDFIIEHRLCVRNVLQWCLNNGEMDFGNEIVKDCLDADGNFAIWNEILIWAAGNGKGADEIGRMIAVLRSRFQSTERQDPLAEFPTIHTINRLVEFAVDKNDPYLAERFLTMGKEMNVNPNAETYVLQMNYRLGTGDVDGALIAYTNLQATDLSTNEDIPAVNKLIVALCNSDRHDHDTVMNVAADLTDRRARFDHHSVVALSILHLDRDEVHDVIDLLNTHSYHFSSSERSNLRNRLVAYCCDKKTAVARCWDGYTILRTVFDEMPRDQRTEIMLSLFNRDRADMAVHVFNGMRSHTREDTIPTVDTYVTAFLATAKSRDLEVLEVIHNQLKLDYHIDVNTYLNNALIIAFTACGRPSRALDFWSDIVAGREGPTYNSIHVALRACEKRPFGDQQAVDIWNQLRQRNVEVDQALWASYAGALAGNGDNQLAISTIEPAIERGEAEPDALLLGSLFNAAPGQAAQVEIERWCKEKYPKVWEELVAGGVDVDENTMRLMKGIDRTVAP